MFRKLMAAEVPNKSAFMSQKRQEQGSYFNVCLLGELNNFLREIIKAFLLVHFPLQIIRKTQYKIYRLQDCFT